MAGALARIPSSSLPNSDSLKALDPEWPIREADMQGEGLPAVTAAFGPGASPRSPWRAPARSQHTDERPWAAIEVSGHCLSSFDETTRGIRGFGFEPACDGKC